MLSRSLPAKLPKLFARFPVRPACCLAPSQRSSPQAICTVSSPSSMLSRSLPAKLSPSYFHGFLSVQHAVSLPPSEAFRKLFARFPVRPACCLAPPCEALPSYLHGFLSVQHAVSLPPREDLPKLFARFPLRPACCLAPSQRSSPQAICTVSIRPACCLAPSQRNSPQAICTVSSPSSMLSHSLPAKLSTSYFHRFQSVQHAVSLPPSEALRKLFARFPLRPACCLAPSQRSSPQAICTVSSRQHAVSLPPAERLRKLFPRFPLRPACCLAPSQQSFPQAICIDSSPSSMLSRCQHAVSLPPSEALPKLFARFSISVQHAVSLPPAKLSESYFLSVQHAVSLPPSEALRKLFPRFPVVQHAVSLPPSEAFRKLFARFSIRPACCLAPSQRSSP